MLILLDAGANINARTGDEKVFGMSMGGKTPVMTAAGLGRFDIVYELLGLGADYNLKDDSGRGLADQIVSMNDAFVPDSDSARSLEKVITWLSERGVTVPE